MCVRASELKREWKDIALTCCDNLYCPWMLGYQTLVGPPKTCHGSVCAVKANGFVSSLRGAMTCFSQNGKKINPHWILNDIK